MAGLPVNEIICGHNVDVLAGFPAECIDLTVTSPPYDNLRAYKGFVFDFEGIAQQLYRVTKQGGAVVWVVADATIDGSETGTSFRQALRFMEIGFRLHDTMIYQKASTSAAGSMLCYLQTFEYMFVFSKGKPSAINILRDRKNQSAGITKFVGRKQVDGKVKQEYNTVADFGRRFNIWQYNPNGSADIEASTHDAPFPEKLAEDHILSWSNPDDIVLDPFIGSGTTAKMAIKHHRQYIGIDVSAEYCELARRRIAAVQSTLL